MIALTLAVSNVDAALAHDRQEDAVLEWNRIAFDGVLREQLPPIQMRIGAILHLAVFEGVNAVTGEYESAVDTVNRRRALPRRAPR